MGFLNKSVLKFLSARCVILIGLYGHGLCLVLAALVYTLLMDDTDNIPSHSNRVTFQVLTCMFQAIQGGLMSSVTLSSLCMGSAYYRDDMGKVNGTYYLGAVIPHGVVPVLANAIYHSLGGYSPPLYIFGAIAFVLAFSAHVIFIIKDFDFRFDGDDNNGSAKSLPIRTYIPLVQSYILTAYLSYLQLTLPHFAVTSLGFTVIGASLPLFIMMISIAVVNVIITFYCPSKSNKILHFLLMCCTLDAIAAFLIFPPKNASKSWISAMHYIVYPLLCTIGMSDAYSTINTTPAMIYLYSTAHNKEPTDCQKHTMSSLWIAGNGLSYALGAYLAGFIDQIFKEDFSKAGVFWGSLALLCSVSLLVPILSYKDTRKDHFRIFEEESYSSVSSDGN